MGRFGRKGVMLLVGILALFLGVVIGALIQNWSSVAKFWTGASQ